LQGDVPAELVEAIERLRQARAIADLDQATINALRQGEANRQLSKKAREKLRRLSLQGG
jgi:hypothetical protein